MRLKTGTRIETLTARREFARIAPIRKVSKPMPGAGWYIVRFDDGGQICMHERGDVSLPIPSHKG